MNLSDSIKELMKKAQKEMEKRRISRYEGIHRTKKNKYKLPNDYYFKGTGEEIKEYERSRN